MTGMLTLGEDATYYFDDAAADRAVRFIETFIVHLTGPKKGERFKLEPIQKRIIRDLFGWKWRDIPAHGQQSNCRRFTDVYWEGAVGCGKSPLLAAIGLYGLCADGEAAAEIWSLAATFSQARIVFDMAKGFVAKSPALSRILEVVDREIRHRASGSVWKITSGKGPGAGTKAHIILADEVHDMGGSGPYDDLNDRKHKRTQPICHAATNAGKSRASFCWKLREKAVAALKGEGDPTLYPIIWAADEDDRTDDPVAWRKANPLIDITVSERKVAAICVEKMKDDVELAEFRRLYLSIWPKTGAGQWLDLGIWDDCVATFDPVKLLAAAPQYIGLDLSQCDDLCAAVSTWLTPSKLYVGARFWMPRVTAEKYQEKEGVPWVDWAAAGHINLVDSPTIDLATRRAIAAHVTATSKIGKLVAVCYDSYRADETIASIEASGATCVPIAQGFGISPGCMELDRRLKERTIIVPDNPVFRFCAENAQVLIGSRGDVCLVKPNAKNKYAGRRGAKIDAIAALATALTEARKHTFAKNTQWKGQVCSLSPARPAASR